MRSSVASAYADGTDSAADEIYSDLLLTLPIPLTCLLMTLGLPLYCTLPAPATVTSSCSLALTSTLAAPFTSTFAFSASRLPASTLPAPVEEMVTVFALPAASIDAAPSDSSFKLSLLASTILISPAPRDVTAASSGSVTRKRTDCEGLMLCSVVTKRVSPRTSVLINGTMLSSASISKLAGFWAVILSSKAPVVSMVLKGFNSRVSVLRVPDPRTPEWRPILHDIEVVVMTSSINGMIRFIDGTPFRCAY